MNEPAQAAATPRFAAAATPRFDAAATARKLLRTVRWGTLATLRQGAPYASLVTLASDIDGTPLLLISRLALHTRNLAADSRVCLLLADVGGGDPLDRPRVSIAATAQRIAGQDVAGQGDLGQGDLGQGDLGQNGPAGTEDSKAEPALARARRRFLARHPEAELYAGFADFSFWRLAPSAAHLVAGFGRIVDLAPADLLTGLAGCDDLVAAEAGAIAHLNADHADALSLYATRLIGAGEGVWRAVGLDPDGLDLDDGARTVRLAFPRRVPSAGVLRQVLKALAEEARSQA